MDGLRLKRMWLTALLLCAAGMTRAQTDDVLSRVLAWPDSVRRACAAEGRPCLPTDTFETNVYTKYRFQVLRRNFTMLTVPNMFHIAHGRQRDFFGEMYSRVKATERKEISNFRNVHVSTMRHRRRTLKNLRPFISPHVYAVTLMDDYLLSPLHGTNSHFYRYTTETLDSVHSLLSFRPKRKNTQMVSGEAKVETATGRLLAVHMEGEYDMARFSLNVQMGDSGVASLRVIQCDAEILLHFIGNKIKADFTSVSDLPVTLPTTIANVDSLALMEELRPLALNATDSLSFHHLDSLNTLRQQEEQAEAKNKPEDSEPRNNWGKDAADAVWDAIQDNMLHSIQAGFGDPERHAFSIGPIFNPLYFDYSKSRGLTYKLHMDFQYRLGENSRLLWEFSGGYAFKQRLVYFNTPLTYFFNQRRNGFVQVELASGNRITSSDVLERVKLMHRNDTIDFESMNLDYFKDMTVRCVANYAFSSRLAGQVGFIYHRRSAVNPSAFTVVGQESVYKAFAPTVEVTWRPFGRRGPILTADVEQGMPHLFSSDTDYSRWEFDGSWILPLHCTRTLSMRLGVGFYLSKGSHRYFLDYTNFRKNNIPGGWRDDWSGEFELLDAGWYNASDYYVRLNSTYESPLLVLSRLPWVGSVVERERIYFSALAVRNYFPFVELGYGMTNRVFSAGTFVAFSPHGYEGFGFKFGFELFSDW